MKFLRISLRLFFAFITAICILLAIIGARWRNSVLEQDALRSLSPGVMWIFYSDMIENDKGKSPFIEWIDDHFGREFRSDVIGIAIDASDPQVVSYLSVALSRLVAIKLVTLIHDSDQSVDDALRIVKKERPDVDVETRVNCSKGWPAFISGSR